MQFWRVPFDLTPQNPGGKFRGISGKKSAKKWRFLMNFFPFFKKIHNFFPLFFPEKKVWFLCLCYPALDLLKIGEKFCWKNAQISRNFPEIFPAGHFREFPGIFGGFFVFPSRKTVWIFRIFLQKSPKIVKNAKKAITKRNSNICGWPRQKIT